MQFLVADISYWM